MFVWKVRADGLTTDTELVSHSDDSDNSAYRSQ